jgi:anti-sigma regulatory factor (Ser/Thr protein kinase)
MREELGPDAERVVFVDNADAFTRPAKTLAFYNRNYHEALKRVGSLRAISHSRPGGDPREARSWAGFEAAVNRSFSHLPAWVLCSYDANAVPDTTLENVWRTHPEVVTDQGWNASGKFEDPTALMRMLAGEPEVLHDLRSIPFVDIESFREVLARELVAEHVPEAKVIDALLAATELAANAVEHGGGVTAVRVGNVDGRFVLEMTDRGPGFDDPAAGYLVPREGRGSGLWVVRQLTWDLEFLRSAEGFTARIWL